MAGLQQAINMPSNNNKARVKKYNALVAALSSISGALDDDGDIDFGEDNTIYNEGYPRFTDGEGNPAESFLLRTGEPKLTGRR